jgi:Protein of unknown function (DUF3096)
MSDLTAFNLPQEQPAKVAPFVGENEADIRKMAAGYFSNRLVEVFMTMTLSVGPLIALIAGILILVMPRLLNYIVALYLILIGVLGLFSHHGQHII